MWERYCRGVNAIVYASTYLPFNPVTVLQTQTRRLSSNTLLFRYMVDAADSEKFEAARQELHALLEKPQLAGMCVYSFN